MGAPAVSSLVPALAEEQTLVGVRLGISLGSALFQFGNYLDWRDFATSRYQSSGYLLSDTIALDAAGRIADRGSHFQRAEADKTYPITVYARQAVAEGGQQ